MQLTTLCMCILWGLWGVAALTGQTASCPLAAAKNGEMVVLRGEVLEGAHNLLLRPVGCAERVILVYGDDPSLGNSKVRIKRDKAFKQYETYLKAEQKLPANAYGTGPLKYRVSAEFHGRLDITESAGLKKDPKTGTVTGIEGFGSPLPFTRYRLVVASVSKVEAVDRILTPATEQK